MVFFVPPERREALCARLKKLLRIPFSFLIRRRLALIYEPGPLYDQWLVNGIQYMGTTARVNTSVGFAPSVNRGGLEAVASLGGALTVVKRRGCSS